MLFDIVLFILLAKAFGGGIAILWIVLIWCMPRSKRRRR